MTGYLLDTNVVSEVRKSRPAPVVVDWLRSAPSDAMWVSVLTLGELRRGAASLFERDEVRAAAIVGWIDRLEDQFGDRVIDVDRGVMRAWAALPRNRTLPAIDSLLVATAASRGLALVTRNVRDVAGLGVDIIDPWSIAG